MIAAWGSSTYVVCNDIASLFKEAIGESCELLPVNVEGSTWFVLNVISKLDALDSELTEINYKPNGRRHRARPYKRFVVDCAKVSTPRLFKLNDAPINLYTSNAADSFLNLVVKHEVTGVSFYEVESSNA
ncbi:imm11 family protein [Thaumasiovibrio sp. DFM-14]|uniref:imm11 family protein n=1 Tax=Thaumasiovibrio sp. DFM-14 TaxID=3384792 RepID=UPI0039A2E755